MRVLCTLWPVSPRPLASCTSNNLFSTLFGSVAGAQTLVIVHCSRPQLEFGPKFGVHVANPPQGGVAANQANVMSHTAGTAGTQSDNRALLARLSPNRSGSTPSAHTGRAPAGEGALPSDRVRRADFSKRLRRSTRRQQRDQAAWRPLGAAGCCWPRSAWRTWRS